MRKKLTILISLYNSGDWILNRIENLLMTNTIDDSEIWCINADSPDSRDHDVPISYPVKYVKLPNRVGVYTAWNYAISNSDSIYITNANSDDIVAPDCYEKLMKSLDSSHKYDFAYPSWYSTTTSNQKWNNLIDIDRSGIPGNFSGNIDSAGVGHFPLWRRSVHDKVGMFDINFNALGDAEFWVRSYFKGNSKFCWINEFLGCYLWRNGQNLWNTAINDAEWNLFHQKVASHRC